MFYTVITVALLLTIASAQDQLTKDTKDDLIGLLEQLVPETTTSPPELPVTTPLPDCERCVSLYSTGYEHILNTYFIGPDSNHNTTSRCDITYLSALAQDIITIEKSVRDCSNEIKNLISHMEVSITALLAIHCEQGKDEEQTTTTTVHMTTAQENTNTSAETGLPRFCAAGAYVLTPLAATAELGACRAYDQTMGHQPPEVLSRSHTCPPDLLFDTTSCACNWLDLVNCSAQLAGSLPRPGVGTTTPSETARRQRNEELVREIINLVNKLSQRT